MKIRVTADIGPLSELMRRLEPQELKGALENMGEAGVSLVRESFRRSANAYGEPWKALDPDYLATKPGGNPDPLVSKDAGLMNSFNARTSGMTVEIGTPRKHAVYHQGDPSHPSKGIIPERSFLPKEDRGLPPSWRQEILKTLEAYLGV